MSFGSAVRFQVAPDEGKPSIFWHKDAAQKKTRKFGYKNKELRYPLRKPAEEPEPEVKPAELERQKNKTDFIKRNREKAKGKEAEKKEHPAANTVTLTQDQLNAILASVGRLSSGKENGLRISIDPDSSEIQIDKASKGGQDGEGKEEKGAKEETKGGSKGGPDLSIYSFVNGQLVRENTMATTDAAPSIVREPPLETSKEEPKVKEESKTVTVSNGAVPPTSQAPSTLVSPRRADDPPFVVSKHMTVAERKRLQWARERAEMAGETEYDPWGRPGAGAPLRGADGNILSDYNTRKEEVVRKSQEDSMERALRHARQQQASQVSRPPLSDRNAPLPTSDPQPLTNNFMFGGADRKVSDKEEQRRRWVEELDKQREEKRLQKMKEKEWLRGGPDTGSQPVSTMQQQHQQQQLQLQQQLQQQQLQQQQQLLQQRQQQQQQPHQQLQQQQQQQQQSSTGQTKETPAAMRSSFVIGQLAPNETRFDNTKAEEKKRWLAELEKQMEEKRQKKLLEKQRELGAVEDTWADRLSYPEPKQQPDLPITALTSDLSPRVPFATEKEDVHRVNSAPLTASQTLALEENKSYIRGQNVYIDPVTRQELSDKRHRHLELQDALKAQIEEKKRLKDLEREKVRLEEMAEEQRLKAEQARIQLQYQQDQQKLRQKEEQRQSKINELKSKMDEAQEAANQERMLRRLQALQDGGHDVSHLRAHYDALSPRTKVVAPTQVPGLSPRDLGGGVAPQLQGGPYVHAGVMALRDSSVEHQPYVENRVLTPSRYRNPSLPHTDPSSPKREFGTQTIERRRPSSGVEIEYQPRPGDQEEGARAGRRAVEEGARARKTTKAAATREQRTKSEPGRRPQPPRAKEEAKPKGPQVWNYNNQRHKKPVKQSERDPHFEQRKREREERKAQREQQLLALVEANKHAIPGEKPSGSHGRRAVEDGAGPGPRAGGHRGDDQESAAGASRMTSYHDHIPHVLSPAIQELTEPELNLHPNQARSPAPHHHQPGISPPVPSVRHRGESQFEDRDLRLNTHRSGPPMSHAGPNTGRSRMTHYDDLDPLAAPDGDFVPFMRTSEVLDPARAAEPLQVSRENTRVLNARNAYLGSRNPGSYGQTLSMYNDAPSQNNRAKDPILNPELVKGHPTARQDAILAQLSTLKQSLIQRQREIETYMEPPALEPQ